MAYLLTSNCTNLHLNLILGKFRTPNSSRMPTLSYGGST